MNFFKIGMIIGIELITKQLINVIASELFRWQADAMNHQQANILRVGAEVKIGRWNLDCAV